MDQQPDGPFAAAELIGDFVHSQLSAVSQINGLLRAGTERFETGWQVLQCVARVGAAVLHELIEFQAQLRPGHFPPPADSFDVFAEQIASDADEPGPDLRGAGELFPPLITAEKCLLRQILGLGGIEEPGPQIAVHRVLIKLDNRREGLLIAALSGQNQALMGFSRRGIQLAGCCRFTLGNSTWSQDERGAFQTARSVGGRIHSGLRGAGASWGGK